MSRTTAPDRQRWRQSHPPNKGQAVHREHRDKLMKSVGDDFDAEAAGARAVEFGEENSLPAAELELAAGDEDCGGSADERGLDVRIGVAFGVAVIRFLRHEA